MLNKHVRPRRLALLIVLTLRFCSPETFPLLGVVWSVSISQKRRNIPPSYSVVSAGFVLVGWSFLTFLQFGGISVKMSMTFPLRLVALCTSCALFLSLAAAQSPANADKNTRYLSLGDSLAFGLNPLIAPTLGNFIGYPEIV